MPFSFLKSAPQIWRHLVCRISSNLVTEQFWTKKEMLCIIFMLRQEASRTRFVCWSVGRSVCVSSKFNLVGNN